MAGSGQTILVTGGAGFIGSHFVDLALASGRRVVVLDAFTYAGHRESLEHIPPSDRLLVVEGDIRDAGLVSRLLRDHAAQAVVNFAAETHVDRSIDGPAEFIGTNVVGTFELLRASLSFWEQLPADRRERFRFLQVSTDEVFGSIEGGGRFTEDSALAPNSPYSASKAAADHLAFAWHGTYDLPTIVTHCSNNYGPRQHPEKLIPTTITSALDGRRLPVYGDGRNVRDWIHVRDHCRGVLSALERGQPGRRYCFGGGEEWKNVDLVRRICAELDGMRPRPDGRRHEEAIEFVADRPGHDRRYAIDDARARRELGYAREQPFARGIAETVRWYAENPAWCEQVMAKGGSR